MILWDIFDIVRKVFLTGLIMFVDPEEGSSRVLRLILATVVSSLYMSILSYACPYKKIDDFQLAIISNTLLICCFTLGIIIQLCDNDTDLCKKTIGISFDSSKATVAAVVLTLLMLVITSFFSTMVVVEAIAPTTIYLTSTGYQPNLELPKDVNHHALFIRYWRTGDANIHSIGNKLRFHIPGVKIWTELDNLEETRNSSQLVADCAILMVYYSEGYFSCGRCRSEIYAAVALNKPIIVLHDGVDDAVIKMKEDCVVYCNDGPDITRVLKHLCAIDPILWLNRKHFEQESVKLVAMHIFTSLPFYQTHITDLEKGLKLGGSLGPICLSSQLDIIVSNFNEGLDANDDGCEDIAREVKALAIDDKSLISPEIKCSDNLADIQDKERRQALLIYINEPVFTDMNEKLEAMVKCAIDLGMKIVLVRDHNMPQKVMDIIERQTPNGLKISGLYDNIIVPLYDMGEYRKTSLRYILLNMDAELVVTAAKI